MTQLEDIRPPLPTLIYLFGDGRTFASFRPRRGVEGYMSPALHRNFIAVNASRAEQAMPTAFHEFVHLVERNASSHTYPSWYEEGFAELLSTARVADREVFVGGIPANRARTLVYGNLLGLRRILTATDVLGWSDQALGMFYAQSWALTHFLHYGHYLGHRRWVEGLTAYLHAFDRGEDPEDAVATSFGSQVEELERDLIRYIRTGQIPTVPFPFQDAESDPGVEVTPLARGEQLYLLADLALRGRRSAEAAPGLLQAALEADPDHARAGATLASLVASREPESAAALIERTLELAPRDPAVHALAADALMALARAGATGSALVEHVARAQSHYRTSLELDPAQAAASAGLARTLRSHDPEEAMRLLELARTRAPGYPPLDVELAELYLEADRTLAARDLVRRMSSQPHDEALKALDPRRVERLLRDSGVASEGERSTRHLHARLELETPDGQRITGPLGLAEVAGRAGLWEATLHDVIILLDESNSTLQKLPRDVDGDGASDSIVEAELAAARRLVERLDPATTRVALVTFTASAQVRVPLGPPAAVLAALDAYAIHYDPTGTSHAAGLAVSLQEFADRADPEARRQRSVLLLSDGVATVPSRVEAAELALEVAGIFADYGIRIHVFALGRETSRAAAYRAIADATLGTFVPVEEPGDIVVELARVRLTGLEDIEVTNTTTEKDARAVRVFPDGWFDAFVELEPGVNEIEVVARIPDREPLRTRITLEYAHSELATAEDRERLEELRNRLELRTAETELYRELRRSASQRHAGDVSVGIEDD